MSTVEIKDAALAALVNYETKDAAGSAATVAAPAPTEPSPTGVVEALVAVTGVRDAVNDIIVPGAFRRTLAERPRPKVCLGHDWNRPIGKTLDIKELMPGDPALPAKTADGRPWPREAGGLWARFQTNLDSDDGRNAFSAAKFYGPAESTYSIGYRTVRAKHRGGTRHIHDLDVFEYGPVLNPANALATLQSIKSDGNDLTNLDDAVHHQFETGTARTEVKMSYVRDANYWGKPYGTPITRGMKPRGKSARDLRKQGIVPSTSVGTMATHPENADNPAKPTRMKPDDAASRNEDEGLFSPSAVSAEAGKEHYSGRVRAGNPKGNDQEHVDNLAEAIGSATDPDRAHQQDDQYNEAMSGLLDEGITPNELRADLRNHPGLADLSTDSHDVAGARHGTTATPQQRVDQVIADYAQRYRDLAASQRASDGQGDGKPKAEQEARAKFSSGDRVTVGPRADDRSVFGAQIVKYQRNGDFQVRDDRNGTTLDVHHSEMRAAEPDAAKPETSVSKPAAPQRSSLSELSPAAAANTLAGMRTGETADHIKDVPDEHLQRISNEFARRARGLGKPGQRSGPHAAVEAELSRRARDFEAAREADRQAAEKTAMPSVGTVAEHARGLAAKHESKENADAAARSVASTNSVPSLRTHSGQAVALGQLMNHFALGKANGEDSAAFSRDHQPDQKIRDQRADQATRAADILEKSGVDHTGKNDEVVKHLRTYADGLRKPEPKTSAESGSKKTDAPAAKPTGKTATISPADQDEAANAKDDALGITEEDDGSISVTSEVAARQDRVSKLLSAGTGGLSRKSDSELTSERGDLAAELTLQTAIKDRGTGGTAKGSTSATPSARPGLAGAAQDHAEALKSGDTEKIKSTRARLESSVRRSRAGSDTARALADHVNGNEAGSAEKLHALSEKLRAEARSRRNERARARRAAKRFDIDRIKSLIGEYDTEIARRGGGANKSKTPTGAAGVRAGGVSPKAPEPLTDEQYSTATKDIEKRIDRAFKDGQATDVRYTVNGDGQMYTPERAKVHKQLLAELYVNADSVPNEGKAVIAGGLGGAGKSTVLRDYAGIDQSQYFTINPDDIKEKFAEHGLIPQIEGLSPMEASALVHEESSYLANLLALRAYQDKKNVMWDITMSRKESVLKRISELEEHGYSRPDAVFVDIPVETSVSRALARHRRGAEKFRAGQGHGGRYVPPAIIRKAAHPEKSSANRHVFDQLAPKFGNFAIYDNSVNGRDPQKIAGTGRFK